MKTYLTNLAAAAAIIAMIGLGMIMLAHACIDQDNRNRAAAAHYVEGKR